MRYLRGGPPSMRFVRANPNRSPESPSKKAGLSLTFGQHQIYCFFLGSERTRILYGVGESGLSTTVENRLVSRS